MKDRHFEEKPACSVSSTPFPSEVNCPHCEIKIELWSDETEITCKMCGDIVCNPDNLMH